MKQCDGMGGDGLATSDRIHSLVGLPFDADLFDANSQRAGETAANGVLEWRDLRPLEDHDDIDLSDGEARAAHQCRRMLKKLDARCAPPLRIGIRKMYADISKARRAKDGIGNGVTNNVRVGMPLGSFLERHRHAGKDQRRSFHQPVEVITDADAGCRCSGWSRAAPLRGVEVFARRDLHVARVAVNDANSMTGAFGEGGLVGRLDSRSSEFNGSTQHSTSERLRSLREVDSVSRQGGVDDRRRIGANDALDGVVRRQCRDGAAECSGSVDAAADQVR
jgi:hypothetical protein